MTGSRTTDSVRVQLRSLTFSGGQVLQLEPDSIVVLVGPNNAGKTSTLREILGSLEKKENGPVLALVDWLIDGGENALRAWMDANVHLGPDEYQGRVWSWLSNRITPSALGTFWTSSTGMAFLAPVFVNFLSVENRLHLSVPQDVLALRDAGPKHPVHVMVLKDSLERKISEQLRASFGTGIVLNRSLTSKCEVYVGDAPPKDNGEDRASPSYVSRLQALPRLENEGHGIRSYFGCLLGLLASPGLIHLIDEPECFLHPPHARRLGHALVELAPSNGQVLIATHSPDVLQGVIDASSARVTIVRLTRSGRQNNAFLLKPDDLRQLWTDPLLRYSNVLHGLFNEEVIICESDADCRFYEAMCEVSARPRDLGRRAVLFTSTAGKDRMATVVRALRTLGVPTRLVPDLDLLQEEATLRDIVGAMGGEWGRLRNNWHAIVTSLQQRPLVARLTVDRLNSILRENRGPHVSTETAERIREELRSDNTWAAVKKAGILAFPHGQTQVVLKNFIEELRRLGIFVVEVGELESFETSAGNHGSRWLAKVMERDLATDSDLRAAREFAARLVAPL